MNLAKKRTISAAVPAGLLTALALSQGAIGADPQAQGAATPGLLATGSALVAEPRVESTADTESEGQGVEAADDASEGPDVRITGPDLERASRAALAVVGEGRVTETEVGDEESYYEVEVTVAGGRQVDVQLDESFAFVGTD